MVLAAFFLAVCYALICLTRSNTAAGVVSISCSVMSAVLGIVGCLNDPDDYMTELHFDVNDGEFCHVLIQAHSLVVPWNCQ